MKTDDGIHEFFEGDVQYPFADVGEPNLVHISEITQENRHSYTYTCPYCKKGLRPRLGTKKAHCYAHKPGESCELDRYIHTTAERLLKEKWDRDEPFEIKMNVRTECKELANCFFRKGYDKCEIKEKKTFDLKKQYSQCIVEKKYGEFVPDLCLIDNTGQHEPIFIEIWSKHKNSEKKAQSDYMIIEIHLKTTEELEELPKHPITESETVTFSHFKTIKKTPSKDYGPRLMRYILYEGTLKSYVIDKSVFCSNYKTKHPPKSIFEVVCSQDEIHTTQQFWSYCTAIAIDRGYNIRSCYLCQLSSLDKRKKEYDNDVPFNPNRPVGCPRYIDTQGLIECKPEEAMTCEQFKLKDQPLNYIKAIYANINRYIWFKKADGTVSEEYQERKDYWKLFNFDKFK